MDKYEFEFVYKVNISRKFCRNIIFEQRKSVVSAGENFLNRRYGWILIKVCP